MKILGIGGSDHDISACLLEDGMITVAIEEERLSREKHSVGVKSSLLKSVDYCLSYRGYELEDIDYFVTNDIFMTRLNSKKLFMDRMIKINHHLAHIASSYYLSSFDKAGLFVSDGAGSIFSHFHVETISLGYASDTNIRILNKVYGQNTLNRGKKIVKENSLGQFYSFFSNLCGFGVHNDGKVMGLAPYGSDKYLDEFRKLIKVTYNKGELEVDIDLNSNYYKNLYKEIEINSRKDNNFKIKADYAYAAQVVMEEVTFQLLNLLYDKTKCDNLCYSGGVALNSVLNGKLKKNTSFRNIFIPPAPNDSGTAIGAALYAYYNIFNQDSSARYKLTNAYMGKEYSEEEIGKALLKYSNKITVQKVNVVKEAAESLSKGKIIGWFQGKSEFGPRALGNRSILADARQKDMKDIINRRIKFRESFRPFAPVIINDFWDTYFDTDFEENPFMLYVADVKEDKKQIIPAVTHVDGSARVQIINRATNLKYYDLIMEYYKLTGVPVLLNTSFNVKGEPIVETPEHAIRTFVESDLDVLYLYDYCIHKKLLNSTCEE